MPADRSEPVRPRSTYRLQLLGGVDFAAAADLVPYLAELGVSHLYLSPILQAATGSTHGYDIVDHRRISRELGGEGGYRRLREVLGRHGLGQVLDIVPNHMAIGGPENPLWWDVLENGPASRYAHHFDVDWAHPEPHLRNTVLLPVLGDHYGRVLEAGELALEWTGRRFVVAYGDARFPVAPRSLDGVLRDAAARAGDDELASLADAHADLPPPDETDPRLRARRDRDKRVLARRVARLAAERPEVDAAIRAAVAAVGADVEALDGLLGRQNYRLAWWRAASRDLGYRRFFDISTLVGLRVEDEEVFLDTHALLLDWLAEGVIDGIRVDHPDGLRDPVAYAERLRAAAPHAWIVAEKIIVPGEAVPDLGPIDGTTGYEFLTALGRVLLDPAGEAPLTALAASFAKDADGGATPPTFAELARAGREQVLQEDLGSELGRLTAILLEVLETQRRHRDHTRHDIHEALLEILVAFPVYRTYVRPWLGEPASAHDTAAIRAAVATVREQRPEMPDDLYDVVAELLLGRHAGDLEAEFVARFQQLTGPVMAKGVEDTAFYRDVRLLALDEVGGDPGAWALEPGAFHAAMAEVQASRPATMVTTSTHDTKRSEGVRARLLVFAEPAAGWPEAAHRLARLAIPHRRADLPDGPTELAIHQTVIGAWPISTERVQLWLLKAVREAKVRTGWTAPDEVYEAAMTAFVRDVLADPRYVAEVEAIVAGLLRPGRVNALSQALVKLTAPGIPDLYQGTELWSLRLVDPDNREPVDARLGRTLLAELDAAAGPAASTEDLAALAGRLDAAIDDPADPGLPKLWLTARALRLRRDRAAAFGPGEAGAYRPLRASGERAAHVLAFARGETVVTVAVRLPATLGGDWADTRLALPPGRFANVLTGERGLGGAIAVRDLLARFPVALLARDNGG